MAQVTQAELPACTEVQTQAEVLQKLATPNSGTPTAVGNQGAGIIKARHHQEQYIGPLRKPQVSQNDLEASFSWNHRDLRFHCQNTQWECLQHQSFLSCGATSAGPQPDLSRTLPSLNPIVNSHLNSSPLLGASFQEREKHLPTLGPSQRLTNAMDRRHRTKFDAYSILPSPSPSPMTYLILETWRSPSTPSMLTNRP